jgi:4-oxalmesaconate hydratase
MIIDIHGHFTTTPPSVGNYRKQQVEAFNTTGSAASVAAPVVTDAEIRHGIDHNQLARMKERGTDLTVFSPRAVGMDHHTCDEAANVAWARFNNDLIHRVCTMYPEHYIGCCQLPQAPGVPPRGAVIDELRRCVEGYGFIACNLNPDPTGGRWADPPLHDKGWWYPLYEELVRLDVPAMIHVSGSCNAHFDPVATHYINGDTTAFVQFLFSDLFKDFPTLKFVIPHGGGAVPYHWGRYRGLSLDRKLGPLEERVLSNVFFDTCVYHQAGIDLLLKVVPAKNILFASETVGAVQGIDPNTGHHFDDTRRYVDASTVVGDADKRRIFSGNALGVYKRLAAHPKCRG